jgi:LuxR family transcriptional regulator, maltose regulon positive regulatory protein
MNDGDSVALIDTPIPVDTPRLCEDTVPIGRLLERREILLVPSSGVVDQRARAVAAKLSLPHQGFVLGRPRLRRAIEPVRGGGVVGLVAGPGCGKTAFIVDLLRSSDSRTVYFSLDEGDRDPLRFLAYLMAGLAMESPQPAPDEPVAWSGGSGAEAAVMDLTAELMDSIAADARRPTLVAIDDFHLVDSSPQVVEALGLVVRGLPPGWTVLVSSRRPLPLDMEAVSLGGRSVILEARDLRLTPSEVAAWAAQNWGLALEPTEARALWRLSEGWPAALVLLGQQLLAHGGATHADLVGVMARGRDLRAYLERHILSGLDPLTTEVMLAGALLPRVIFPRDDGYLPGSPGEAETALEQLVSRGFLVTRAGRRSYTVHPLVRAYAERQAWGSDEGVAAISRAAGHLERVGENHRAATLYLRAGRFDDAARPLRVLALSSLNALVDFANDGWADLLPNEDDASAGAWLLVAKGRMLQQQMKYAAASALYERAARLLAAAGDDEGLLPVLLGSVFCLFNQGLWDESLAVLKRCRSLAQSAREKMEVLLVEGNVLLSLCRWDEAVEDWEKALAIAPLGDRDGLTLRVMVHRARLFYNLGQYRLARQWAEKALGRASQSGTTARTLALTATAITAFLVGDYETAGRVSGECLDLVQTRGHAFFEIETRLTQAAVAQGRWDYREAVRNIRAAQAIAAEAGDTESSFHAEDMFGDLCRRSGSPHRALEHHRTALQLVENNRLAVGERVRALAGSGIDHVILGKDADARTALEETVRLSRRWTLKGSLAPALFYLGWLHALAGREQDAARCLTEAMHIAEEHGHIHFFSQEARVAVPIMALCDRLGAGSFLRREIVPRLPVRLAAYFEELAKGKTYPTDVPLGVGRRTGLGERRPVLSAGDQVDAMTIEGIEALTDREREVLKMIALGMSNKQIGSKLFISEKTVKTHANHVFRKLGVTSRLQATLAFQSYQRARRAGGAGRSRKR